MASSLAPYALAHALGRQRIARPAPRQRRCKPRTRCAALAPPPCQPQAECAGLFMPEYLQPLDRRTAELYLDQLDDWELREDAQGRLHLTRSWACASFNGALALARRIAALAEGEGQHPDLHLTGWNRLSVDLFTRARCGLTVTDFLMACKMDGIGKSDVLRRPHAAPTRAA